LRKQSSIEAKSPTRTLPVLCCWYSAEVQNNRLHLTTM
jgi:hypothetical protein